MRKFSLAHANKLTLKPFKRFAGTAGVPARSEREARKERLAKSCAPDGAFAGEGARGPSKSLDLFTLLIFDSSPLAAHFSMGAGNRFCTRLVR